MVNTTNLKKDAVLTTANKFSQNNYFNSESHFYESLSLRTGVSVNFLKRKFKPLIKEGFYTFENYQFKQLKFIEGLENSTVPLFILATHKIKDGFFHLKEREYRILLHLDKLKKNIDYYNNLNGTNSPLYPSCNYLAEELGYTYDQVRHSMNKLDHYFEGFRVIEEEEERIHESITYTINLPERKNWKPLIEAKVMEMTGLTNLKDETGELFLVDKGSMKILRQWWKKGVRISLRYYCKMKGDIQEQAERIQKGLEAWRRIKKDWRLLLKDIVLYLESLVDLGVISEVISTREIRALDVHNPEGAGERLELGLANLQLKYGHVK